MELILQNLSNPATRIMVIVSFLITLILIPVSIYVSKRLNILDLPDERKLHKNPVPKSGGIAILVAYFSILAYTSGLDLVLFLSIISISILIILDDIYQLNRYLRLASQIVIVTPLTFNIFLVDNIFNSQLIFIALIFIYCSFINLFNFFDGLNTLLSVQFVLANLFYLINSSTLGLVGSIDDFKILIASVIAFLIYNSFGLIFLGDIGSCFFGIFSATIFLKTVLKGEIINSILILSPLLPILCDTVFTLLIRIKNREKFFSTPHNQHSYQLLAKMKFNHLKVSLFYAFKLILYTFSLNFTYSRSYSVNTLIICLTLIILFEVFLIFLIRSKAYKNNLILNN